MLIDDILSHNRTFVEGRTPKPLPAPAAVSVAIVACYDPRLDPLLRPALGLAEGEGLLLRTAGATIAAESHTLRSLALAIYLFDVHEVLIIGHTSCRMASFPTTELIDAFRRRGVSRDAFGDDDLRHWAGAISTPRDGVLASAAAVASAPFLPADLVIAGAVLDDATGALEPVLRPGDPLPGKVSPGKVSPAPEAAASVPAEATAGAAVPPVPIAAAHPALGHLRRTVQQLAAGGEAEELRRLRGAVETEVHPQTKLALLRRFIHRAAGDSAEVKEAFGLLRKQVEGAGPDLATQLLTDLFGPLLRRPGGRRTEGRKTP